MLRLRFGRSLAVVGVAGSMAFAVGSALQPAGAVTRTGIKCATLSGKINTTVTAKNCTGHTGGASKPISSSALASGKGTITWVNGKKTGIKFTTSTTEHDGAEAKGCPVGTSEIEVKGSVTSDTTGSTHVGAAFHAEVCVNAATGAISLEPGTKAVVAP